MDHSAGLGAGHQRAVGLISTVCKNFAGGAQACSLGGGEHQASRKAHENQVAVHAGNALGNGGGQSQVLGGHVIESAVGLHVLQRHAVGLAEGGQCAHLILGVGLGLGRSDNHVAAAEAHQIRETGVCAHGNAVFFGHSHGFVHHNGVACMVAAGHIDGGDIFHDLTVQTDFVRAEAFAQIAVQVYLIHSCFLLSICTVNKAKFPKSFPKQSFIH